jgi:hypothetical protein
MSQCNSMTKEFFDTKPTFIVGKENEKNDHWAVVCLYAFGLCSTGN